MKKIMILIFLIVGGLTTTITAILQFIDSQEKEKISDNNEKELNNKIEILIGNNLDQSLQISKLSIENSELSKQLAIATKDLTEKNLGGYKISPDAYLLDNKKIKILLRNVDKLTIFNGFVSLVDADRIKLSTIISESESDIVFSSKDAMNYYDVISGDINVGQSAKLPKDYLIEGNRHFYIEFICRKKHIIMHLIIFREEKVIKTLHKLFELNNDTLILLETHGNAPESYWNEHFFENRRLKYHTLY